MKGKIISSRIIWGSALLLTSQPNRRRARVNFCQLCFTACRYFVSYISLPVFCRFHSLPFHSHQNCVCFPSLPVLCIFPSLLRHVTVAAVGSCSWWTPLMLPESLQTFFACTVLLLFYFFSAFLPIHFLPIHSPVFTRNVTLLQSLGASKRYVRTLNPLALLRPALSACLCLCFCLPLSLCQSVCLTLSLSDCCLSVFLSVCLSVCLCLSLSVSVCLCLSLSVCLSVSLSLSLSLSFVSKEIKCKRFNGQCQSVCQQTVAKNVRLDHVIIPSMCR